MSISKLFEQTLTALEFALKDRNDFFITSSFGYQSELIFFLLSELGVVPKCLFIKSKLASGGIDRHMDYITGLYDIDLHVVDRDPWLEGELQGKDFMALDSERKKFICTKLKREPLLDFIRNNSMKIWLSSIRKDQTQARAATEFMEVTDLSVIKISPLYAWEKSEVRQLISTFALSVNDDYFDLCKLNDKNECGLHL
jgi:3'-phosphoadenosine 5'-phosphosulfate sulfotransferase (PAPS reductase)/FAD synthetase